jgi:DNA mismatch endonuclease, patch repair protein
VRRTCTTRPSATSELPELPTSVTSRRMVKQRRRDTQPELALRRALYGRGWRYRVDVAPIAGMRRRADLVFTRARVAVFVDGCFWHVCPAHATRPKSNPAWWQAKLEANAARDRDTDRCLRAAGWNVVRVWEHDSIEQAVRSVEKALQASDRG